MNNPLVHAARFYLPPLEIDPEGTVLVFDKPYQCTSFDLVNKVKFYLKKELKLKVKVGHAGTLDPLATGVLIICVGKFTKRIPEIQSQEKEYTGTIKLGATTPGFDLEKPIDQEFDYLHITQEMVLKASKTFLGETLQVPPQYSAVKVNGKRGYDFARSGEEVALAAKTIFIKEFEITRFELPEVDFRIVCSKGTYIRAIARDFGQLLNSGAHLTSLCRTKIGEYRVEDAIVVIDNE
ncbi:MAG: tRNA pseudouridine(55) synthase TruB [Bacteroidales bacterium]|jgi:tRNA pseudouridine55 synthase|nr:tRNA pseudouridine(55) synthase TruB [Bacteroidales bacterium]